MDKPSSGFMEFDNAIWRYKNEKGIALSQKLSATIYAPRELKPLKDDLMAMHRIESPSFGKPEEKENMRKISEENFVIEQISRSA